ncbi:hypothetical protein MPER_12096, partial [Moniliophthora perniciosa FA553]
MSQETSLPHDPSAKVAGEPLTAGDKAFDLAQQSAFSFKPLSNIKQALCAVHPYAYDPSRIVPAYHYCTHNISSDLHQCIIFDSNEPGARLIGVEYIITEKVYRTLDKEERRLWHSLLTMVAKAGIPSGIDDALEMPALKDLHTTYGKTWHFWQIDRGDTLPLGLPSLMKSANKPADLSPEVVKEHEQRTGTNVKSKEEYRAKHLDKTYQIVDSGTDEKGSHLELTLKGQKGVTRVTREIPSSFILLIPSTLIQMTQLAPPTASEDESVGILSAMMGGKFDNAVALRVLRNSTAMSTGRQMPMLAVIDLTGDDQDEEMSRALQMSMETDMPETKFGPSNRAPDPNWAVVPTNTQQQLTNEDENLKQAIEASLAIPEENETLDFSDMVRQDGR